MGKRGRPWDPHKITRDLWSASSLTDSVIFFSLFLLEDPGPQFPCLGRKVTRRPRCNTRWSQSRASRFGSCPPEIKDTGGDLHTSFSSFIFCLKPDTEGFLLLATFLAPLGPFLLVPTFLQPSVLSGRVSSFYLKPFTGFLGPLGSNPLFTAKLESPLRIGLHSLLRRSELWKLTSLEYRFSLFL